MVNYVTEALRNCPEVGKIVLVGDASLQKAYRFQTSDLHAGLHVGQEQRPEAGSRTLEKEQEARGWEPLFASPGDSPLGSLASGVSVLENAPDAADWILPCTADIPFLSPGAVSEFLRQSGRREADFCSRSPPARRPRAVFPVSNAPMSGCGTGCSPGATCSWCAGRSRERPCRRPRTSSACARNGGHGPIGRFRLPVGLSLRFHDHRRGGRRISSLVGYRGAAVISPFRDRGGRGQGLGPGHGPPPARPLGQPA